MNNTPAQPVDTPTVDKSGQRIRNMFAEIAPRYDLMNHLLSLNIDKSWRKFTVEKLRLIPGIPVLDACTGTGDLALAIAKKYPGQFEVIGTDFCPPMLDIARKKGSAGGSDEQKVQFIEADTMFLPFQSDFFQAATVAFGLRNVSDTSAGLRELVRVTRNGGEVGILEFSRPSLPGLKQLYQFYFRHVLPRVGQAMAKNDQSAYKYLPESVMEFPSGEDLAKLMREAGMADIRMYPLTFGVATLYLGRVRKSEAGT
jgi:demethylmenaquinone methyltransferase/2-methoxy-6-polyprenyl-1,4-benzoquinol methylase